MCLLQFETYDKPVIPKTEWVNLSDSEFLQEIWQYRNKIGKKEI